MPTKQTRSRLGIGIDAFGGQVIDPTQNVIALTDAANKRQDDLRNANNALLDEKVAGLQREATLRAQHAKEVLELTARTVAAMREIDVDQAKQTAARELVSVQTLAATTSKNFDQLFAQIETMRASLVGQMDRGFSQQNERVATLERTSYTGLGKQEVVDPVFNDLVNEMRKLSSGADRRTGRDSGFGISWAVVIAVIGMMLGLFSVFTRPSPSNQAPGQIYVLPSTPLVTAPK